MTDLRIPSPCQESWTGMTPDGRGRHCSRCAKTVVDVTAMTLSAGREFVVTELPARLARGEQVCVRAHADTSGRLQRPGVRRYLLTNGLAAVLAMTMAGCGAEPQVVTGTPEAVPNAQPAPAPPEEKPEPIGLPEVRPLMGRTAPPIRGEVAAPIAPEPGTAARRLPQTGDAEIPIPPAAIMGEPAHLPEVMGDVGLPPTR